MCEKEISMEHRNAKADSNKSQLKGTYSVSLSKQFLRGRYGSTLNRHFTVLHSLAIAANFEILHFNVYYRQSRASGPSAPARIPARPHGLVIALGFLGKRERERERQ